MSKEFNVAVYVHENPRKKIGYDVFAYTKTYNPNWPGYNNLTITADSGREAVKIAKRRMKRYLKEAGRTVNVAPRPSYVGD